MAERSCGFLPSSQCVRRPAGHFFTESVVGKFRSACRLVVFEETPQHEDRLAAQWTPLHESFTTGLTDPAFNSPWVDDSGVPIADATLTTPAECTRNGYLPNSGFEPSLLQYDLTRGGELFRFHGVATIKEQGAYFQDSMNFDRLGIGLGVRGDRYDGISHGSALQPRAGLSYQLPFSGTVLRVSTGPAGLAGGASGTATLVPLAPGGQQITPPSVQLLQKS
jgi:hypothetical protein